MQQTDVFQDKAKRTVRLIFYLKFESLKIPKNSQIKNLENFGGNSPGNKYICVKKI